MNAEQAIEFINRLPLSTKEQRITIFKEFVEQAKHNAIQKELNKEKFKDVLSQVREANFKLNKTCYVNRETLLSQLTEVADDETLPLEIPKLVRS